MVVAPVPPVRPVEHHRTLIGAGGRSTTLHHMSIKVVDAMNSLDSTLDVSK